jgi:hypothetical protein
MFRVLALLIALLVTGGLVLADDKKSPPPVAGGKPKGPKPKRDCLFDGNMVPHGGDVVAFRERLSKDCESETRKCDDGKLISGSFQYRTCARPEDCRFHREVVPHGGEVTAYRVLVSNNCEAEAEKRKCDNGNLSGSFKWPTCGIGCKPWCVDRPMLKQTPQPKDATALCCDNWWSHGIGPPGVCSWHCGVKRWIGR